MNARRGRRLAVAAAAAAAAISIFGTPGMAQAATASSKGIQQVACRPWTFNVSYGSKEKCYAGRGTKVVRISDVHLVTTGNNEGFFTYIERGKEGRIIFHQRERLAFPAARHVELVAIDIV
jgi:hypothetical protein